MLRTVVAASSEPSISVEPFVLAHAFFKRGELLGTVVFCTDIELLEIFKPCLFVKIVDVQFGSPYFAIRYFLPSAPAAR